MTTFAPANLPASVNTVEKLAMWSLGILYQLHKNSRYQESEAAPLVPLITAQDGLAADKSERIIFRSSLPLSDSWREQTTKFWQESQEISNAAIPTSFLP
ncbi:hypothetical protein VB780_01980 [Leptolyngbya sp. CCNP1308]|uniref:hypothetical protein n=1 Tax=Leptolyngbya sp. CCNP1308 TaxID=3110255 RepID=UPI002B2102FD|nr:hypothetical protein [Leptolyngbya sp. CCNP1308]MEA5447319.1 hypothetical protein [Leptolyngbya sp. CCNP1308]